MKIRVLLVSILSACVFVSCRRPQSPVERGEAFFKGFGCVNCHRVGSEGGTYGPDLTLVGFRKNSRWLDTWLKNPHAWRNGTVMPNFHLPEQVRSSLVEYLSSLKGQDFAGKRPWDEPGLGKDPVKQGEVIFEKAGCTACHSQKGAGGYPNNNVIGGLIPPLTFVADGYSKPELKDRIAKGVVPEPADPSLPPPMIQMPAWKEVLRDDELDALVEYLYSIRPSVAGEEQW